MSRICRRGIRRRDFYGDTPEAWWAQEGDEEALPLVAWHIMRAARISTLAVSDELEEADEPRRDGDPQEAAIQSLHVRTLICRRQTTAAMEWIRKMFAINRVAPVAILDGAVLWPRTLDPRVISGTLRQVRECFFPWCRGPLEGPWRHIQEDLTMFGIDGHPIQEGRPILCGAQIVSPHDSNFASKAIDVPKSWRRKNGPFKSVRPSGHDVTQMARV